MVRQAHHERRPAHLFLSSVAPMAIGMVDREDPDLSGGEAISGLF